MATKTKLNIKQLDFGASLPDLVLDSAADTINSGNTVASISVKSADTDIHANAQADLAQLAFKAEENFASSTASATEMVLKLSSGGAASIKKFEMKSNGTFKMYDDDGSAGVGFKPAGTVTGAWVAELPAAQATAVGQCLVVSDLSDAAAPVLSWEVAKESCKKELKVISAKEDANTPLLFSTTLAQAGLFDFNGNGTAADVYLNGQMLVGDTVGRDKEIAVTNPDGNEAHAFQMAGQAYRFNRADDTGKIFVFVDPPFQNRGNAVRGSQFDFDPETAPHNTDETITLANHDLLVGDQVLYSVLSGANVGGLSDGTVYWVLETSGTGASAKIKLAASEAHYHDGTPAIDLTQAGSAGSNRIQRVSIRSGETLVAGDRIGLAAAVDGNNSIATANKSLVLINGHNAAADGNTKLGAKHANLIGGTAIVPPRIAGDLDNLTVGHYFQELFKQNGELETFMRGGTGNVAKIEIPAGETSDGAKVYKIHGGAGIDADFKVASIKRVHSADLNGSTATNDANRVALATAGQTTEVVTAGVALGESATSDYYQSRRANNAICFTFDLDPGDAIQLVVRGE